jgi:replicative DNA helicase
MMLLDRIPPHDVEAEQSVLGAMLISRNAVMDVADMLTPDDFYREANRRTFKAMLGLYGQTKPIDLVTLKDKLLATGELDAVGGPMYLVTLANQVATGANAKHHAAIVKDHSMKRTILMRCTDIISRIYDDEVDELLASMAVDDTRIARQSVHISQVAKELYESMEARYNDRQEFGDRLSGLSTGFIGLDDVTDGLQAQDLIIIGGDAGMGKTAFAFKIADYVSRTVPVHGICLEMSNLALVRRQMAKEADIDSAQLRKARLDAAEWTRALSAVTELSKRHMTFEDRPISKLSNLARSITRAARGGAKLFVVDNLKLIKNPPLQGEAEIASITNELKNLARCLDIRIILISPLNRDKSKRENKRPVMSDLKGSGQIEFDADYIFFLYREGYYYPEKNQIDAELIIAKARDAITPVLKLLWDGSRTNYTEPDWRTQ